MTIGYDKPLYMLPFEHRATFTEPRTATAVMAEGRQQDE